jgi:hypothetical protein
MLSSHATVKRKTRVQRLGHPSLGHPSCGRPAMKSAKDWVKLISAGLVVVLAIAAFQFAHRSLIFELPNGYRGWVTLQFEEPSCPPLQKRGLSLVIPVSTIGRACTSSPNPWGEWRRWHFVYVNPDETQMSGGLNGLVSDESHGISDDRKRFWFFVGAIEEYRKNRQQEPRNP